MKKIPRKYIMLIMLLSGICFATYSNNLFYYFPQSDHPVDAKCKICSKPVYIWKQSTNYYIDTTTDITGNLKNDTLLEGESGGSVESGKELSYSINIAVCFECSDKYRVKFTNILNKTVKEFIDSAIAKSIDLRSKNIITNKINRLKYIESELESLKFKKQELEKTKREIEDPNK